MAESINAVGLGSGVTVLGTGTDFDAIAAVVISGTLLAGTVNGTMAGIGAVVVGRLRLARPAAGL